MGADAHKPLGGDSLRMGGAEAAVVIFLSFPVVIFLIFPCHCPDFSHFSDYLLSFPESIMILANCFVL